jgi:hypothetical protein
MNMVWILSLLICLTLTGGLAMMFFPELAPSFIVSRWKRHFHYFRH